MQADSIRSQMQAQPGSAIQAGSDRLIAAAIAALLGVFLVWGAGFSPIGVLHNAAHDTRHSLAFPCH